MDRDDGLHARKELAVMELILQMYWDQAGLPVMAMDHIGPKADHRERG